MGVSVCVCGGGGGRGLVGHQISQATSENILCLRIFYFVLCYMVLITVTKANKN